MAEFLHYDGQKLHWRNPRDGKPETSYSATSGLDASSSPTGVSLQQIKHQCLKDGGPVPPGTYKIKLWIDPNVAQFDPMTCGLKQSWQIQTVPSGSAAVTAAGGDCSPWFSNWGNNRVRFEPADVATKNACSPIFRNGFHLHDSVKGYSHGCIEIDQKFFTRLRNYAMKKITVNLFLKVDYKHKTTYGGTRHP